MGRIYQGQSSLSLRVMTGCVLHGAQDCLIKFRKPDGTEGSFTAELLDEMKGLLSYDVQDGDLDQPGVVAFLGLGDLYRWPVRTREVSEDLYTQGGPVIGGKTEPVKIEKTLGRV